MRWRCPRWFLRRTACRLAWHRRSAFRYGGGSRLCWRSRLQPDGLLKLHVLRQTVRHRARIGFSAQIPSSQRIELRRSFTRHDEHLSNRRFIARSHAVLAIQMSFYSHLRRVSRHSADDHLMNALEVHGHSSRSTDWTSGNERPLCDIIRYLGRLSRPR